MIQRKIFQLVGYPYYEQRHTVTHYKELPLCIVQQKQIKKIQEDGSEISIGIIDALERPKVSIFNLGI